MSDPQPCYGTYAGNHHEPRRSTHIVIGRTLLVARCASCVEHDRRSDQEITVIALADVRTRYFGIDGYLHAERPDGVVFQLATLQSPTRWIRIPPVPSTTDEK